MAKFYKTTIELDAEAVDAFKEMYPARGMLKHFVNQCLVKFTQQHLPTFDENIHDVVNEVNLEVEEDD